MEVYRIIIILFLLCFSTTVNTLYSEASYRKICEKTICLTRCCVEDTEFVNYTLFNSYCAASNVRRDVTNLTIYDANVQKTDKSFKNLFTLVPPSYNNFSLESAASDALFFPGLNMYLKEDGVLMMEKPNEYNRWTAVPPEYFCIGFENEGETPTFWTNLPDPEGEETEHSKTEDILIISALLTSCVFLLLVLVVYLCLPELRNLGGLVLMANVVSLIAAFLSLAILLTYVVLDEHAPDICLAYTYSTYYFFLANFCWMNIMSFDIWWTFRGYAKARPIHRRGETVKFLTYCVYGFGVPLALTVMLIVLNNKDLTHIPWFVKPNITEHGCFLLGVEKILYLYVPMLILILLNWVFFIMTGYNVWRLNRGTSMLDSPAHGTPAAHRTHKHRLMVYLKLSIVMGISWVLEVVGAVKPDSMVFYLSDAYNLLLGVFIFLIFVCKKKIFYKMENRIKRGFWSTMSYSVKSRQSSTTESDSIGPDTPLQVCPNPSGPKQTEYIISYDNNQK